MCLLIALSNTRPLVLNYLTEGDAKCYILAIYGTRVADAAAPSTKTDARGPSAFPGDPLPQKVSSLIRQLLSLPMTVICLTSPEDLNVSVSKYKQTN